MSGDANSNITSRPGLIAWGEDLPSESSISQLSSTECITHISSGSSHSVVVCASGRVYTLGLNNYHGWMKEDIINVPTLVRDLTSFKITQAACGDDSTFFLTDKSRLFSSGGNEDGQLGLGNTTDSPTPVLVRRLTRVKKVAAGSAHTVVLREGGEVWVCGSNNVGQLGLGHFNNTNKFVHVSYVTDPIIDVSCGGSFTALLTGSGNVMMAGWNRVCQLGQSDVQMSSRFQSLSLPPIAVVACGSLHTAALAVDGAVWVWGGNNNGQLGVGTTVEKSLLSRVEGLESYTVASVFAGFHHTALVTQQGDMFLCGRGKSGELGQGRADIFMPTVFKKSPGVRVSQIVFGFQYSLLNVKQEPRTPSEINQGTVGQQTNSEVRSCVSVGQQTDNQARTCITDWEKTIITSLECPVCFKIMSTPIHMCCNGHTLCGSCYSSQEVQMCPTCRGELICTRNTSLEYISSQIELPCCLCLRRMPVATLDSHDDVCPQRPYRCPIEQLCGWSGCLESMLDHLCSNHPEKTWKHLPHTFSCSLRDSILQTDLLENCGEIFVLYTRCLGNEVKFAVKYVGQPENATSFKFILELSIEGDETYVTVNKQVCSVRVKSEDIFNPPYCVTQPLNNFDTPHLEKVLFYKVYILVKVQYCTGV